MKRIDEILGLAAAEAIQHLFSANVLPEQISFQKTNQEFEGHLTLVVFPFLKVSKKNPEQTAQAVGEYLREHCEQVQEFNVVKGFLNLVIADSYWIDAFLRQSCPPAFPPTGKHILLEYSSPNTNKPLHLGHIRNNLLGYSVAKILEARGDKVTKVNLVNDRGIHICKSMLAWKKWGNGETPESSGLKGDHLVGKYYVEFDKHLKAEIGKLKEEGKSEEEAEKNAPLMLEAQKMLQAWEAGDKEVMGLWKKMNDWVYKGFEKTYSALGVSFDKIYYESDTYLLGKSCVEEGLRKNVFQKEDNGAVSIDLTANKLDKKIVQRADGTSVYITQDIGTAILRSRDFPDVTSMIYTVGNEQDYHFKVLFLILNKLGYGFAKNCYHLSYGMVELPEGKMKSREGTVVDADDLIHEMTETSRETTKELGKIEDFDSADAEKLYHRLAMGALKYFILKVDPKKKMQFNPKESIDFNGNTGPFIQYTHARIKSVLRRAGVQEAKVSRIENVNRMEKDLLRRLHDLPQTVEQAASEYNPSVIANYVYDLAKSYNYFYHECPILKEEQAEVRQFRIQLSDKTAGAICYAMDLLGIEVPERM
ncbi:MAG: arginine--tRNA ligase [Bacteroidia bacterium]|nr:arginine--tRNA ligase [Bacteroidia bacterium]